jgi:hypothetical protein
VTLEPVPELADDGYWYVCAVEHLVLRPTGETALDENGVEYALQERVAVTEWLPGEDVETQPAGISSHAGWTATPAGEYMVVRSPVPLVGVEAIDASAAAVLIAAGFTERPHGRVGGR